MAIDSVLECAAELQEKCGIRFDVDGIRSSVEEIMSHQGIALDEEGIVQACDAVLKQQHEVFPMHAGLLVRSRLGEMDSDEDGNERATGPNATGVLVQRDPKNAQWSVAFGNGTSVWITDAELADTHNYKVLRYGQLPKAMKEVAGTRNENSIMLMGSYESAGDVQLWLALDASPGAHGREVIVSYELSADQEGWSKIVEGELVHEGDADDLLGHLFLNKQAILAEVYQAMVATKPPLQLTHAPSTEVSAKADAVSAADDIVSTVGLAPYSEVMTAMMDARVALIAMLAAPARNTKEAEVRSCAIKAIYATLMPSEKDAILATAQDIIKKNHQALATNGKALDPDILAAGKDANKALHTFGFSLLMEATKKSPALKETFDRVAAITGKKQEPVPRPTTAKVRP